MNVHYILSSMVSPESAGISCELLLALASILALIRVAARWAKNPPDLTAFSAHCERLPWRMRDVGTIAACVFVLFATLNAVVRLAPDSFRHQWHLTVGEAALIETMLLQAVLVLCVRQRLLSRRMSVSRFLGVDGFSARAHAPQAIGLCLAALPLAFLGMWISSAILTYSGFDIHDQLAISILRDSHEPICVRGLIVFLAMGTAPVIEESIFRGILLPAATVQWGARLAIPAVSLIFALVHGHAAGVLPLFIMAVFFAFGYIVFRSLTVPIIMHITFNSLNLLLLILDEYTRNCHIAP